MASMQACPGPKSWLDVKLSSTEIDGQPTNFTGSAVMSDGRVLLADSSNHQILLLDKNFNIQSKLGLPGAPWDVAVCGDYTAVVTLPFKVMVPPISDNYKLQYIHVDTELRAGHTISTGIDRAVAVHAGEIYVGAHGGQYGYHVQVLDTSGTKIRCIEMDFDGKGWIMWPNYITVGTGGTLYHTCTADGTDHITCHTSVGALVYDNKHEGAPRGILADEEGNLLVCCYKSNTIEVLGKNGEHRNVILFSTNGVMGPRSMSYRRSDHALIVTMNNIPSCRAYKLK